MQILQSTDYDDFVPILGNRNVSEQKVGRLFADITSGFNMLQYFPILITEKEGKKCIIDGQHRHAASRRTKNPVYYLVCDGLTLHQIALLNSRGDKWKPADFLNCYIRLGIEDYKVLQDFVRTYRIAMKAAADLLMQNQAKGSTSDAFETGNFKVNYLKESEALLELMDELFGNYVFSKDPKLIAAVMKIQAKGVCDFEKLKSKLKLTPMTMDKQGDVKNYILNIERVYNFKTQTRELLT